MLSPCVVGIDLSLTSTGVVTVAGGRVTSIGRVVSKGKKDDTLQMRWQRLHLIRGQIAAKVGPVDPDLVVIEAPSFGSQYGHPHDRSGLWWMVMASLMESGYRVAQVPPTVRAKYGTGKGNAPKDQVLTDVVRRYVDLPAAVRGNDEADALILAAMGSRHLGQPLEDSLPKLHLAAMDGVAWPAP
jgi:crossover junction endodeoxyribonuclease RuvC